MKSEQHFDPLTYSKQFEIQMISDIVFHCATELTGVKEILKAVLLATLAKQLQLVGSRQSQVQSKISTITKAMRGWWKETRIQKQNMPNDITMQQ